MEAIRRALTTYRNDARAFRSYWRARMDASSKRSRKKKEEKALKQAYHELGTQASETKQAQERKSFGSVKENREKLEGLDAALAERQAEEQAAREELAARAKVRGEEIGVVDAAHRELVASHNTAKEELAGIVRQMREIDDELERPAEKKKTSRTEEDLRAELETLRPTREAAFEKEKAARETRDAKKAELDAEKQAWREEESKHQAAIRERTAAREAAQREVATAKGQLDGSLEDLGKSVALANMGAPELSDSLQKAKGIMRSIEELAKGIEDRRAEAQSLKPETVRFSLVTVAVLVVLAGLVWGIVAIAGGGKKAATGTGGLPVTAPAGTAAVAAAPAAPAAPGLTGEVRAAILDLPSLAKRQEGDAVLFEPTGEMRLTSAEPAAGGASRLTVEADARRRPSPDTAFEAVTVHVRALVDAGGHPLQVNSIAISDEEDRELMRLLEQN